jgi:hypothetical protein
MKYVPLVVLRLLLSLLAIGWLWQMKNGEAIRPLHPINLLIVMSLLIGAICIWIPKTLKVAYIAATTFAMVFGFQIFMLLIAFPSGATFSSNLGPLKFEGYAAHVVLWTPLLAIIVCGLASLYSSPKRAEQEYEGDI